MRNRQHAYFLPGFKMFTQKNGEGGIRTPETLARLTVFKTAAFNRSATSPLKKIIERCAVLAAFKS